MEVQLDKIVGGGYNQFLITKLLQSCERFKG